MGAIATASTGLMAGLHTYILVLEMFLWTTPRGQRAFGLSPAFAQQTKVLAANQGLYNGFLASGLVWGLRHPNAEVGKEIQLFFLGCIIVAGAYGGATSSRKILWVQFVPGILAATAVYLGL